MVKVKPYDVLRTCFGDTDTICFVLFSDMDHTEKCFTESCTLAEYDKFEPRLHELNDTKRSVSFVVNYGGRKNEDITRINAQFAEMDNGTIEEMWKKLQAFPLKPSIVIKTQKSLHAYWLLKPGADVGKFRPIQKRLVKQFDADPACVNEARALRLPGFYHHKTGAPVMVECLEYHPELRYTQEELEKQLPLLEGERVQIKEGTDQGLDTVLDKCLFLQHCHTDAETLSEPEWYAMITNMANFMGGTKMIHEFSAAYPGYSRNETQKKINHYLEGKTKPMTCEKIHELGFKCPKYEDGGCGVKSPAALCYKPRDPKELTTILASCPVAEDDYTNINSAREFIKKHLYNVDPVIADAMIAREVKKHFNLSKEVITSLRKECKGIINDFAQKKTAREGAEKEGRAEWYRADRKGVKFLPGVLAEYLAKNVHAFIMHERFYLYNQGVYRLASDSEAKRIVQTKMLVEETSMHQINDACAQWSLQIRTPDHMVNPNPYVINLKNGLYNVQEKKLIAHTPEYLSTMQLLAEYEEGADCPKFKRYLLEVMDGDEEQVKLIQEVLGYCMIPTNAAQKCVIFTGEANAGKSVLLNVIEFVLLGQNLVSHITMQNLGERFQTSALVDKLANIFADLSNKKLQDSGTFKALTGQDSLSAEYKGRDVFSFTNVATLLFSCNDIPKSYEDRSNGFYRRLLFIPFKKAIPEAKRDTTLLDQLKKEANGILMFAIEGLDRLMANDYHFSETEVNRRVLQQYKEDCNSVLSFVRDCCIVDASSTRFTGTTELYNAYIKYCEECGFRSRAINNFSQELANIEALDNHRDSVSGRKGYQGIWLRED